MARYTVSLLQFMKPRGTCGGIVATSLRGLITVTCYWFQKNVLVLPEPYWRYMHEAKICTHATHALIPSHAHAGTWADTTLYQDPPHVIILDACKVIHFIDGQLIQRMQIEWT